MAKINSDDRRLKGIVKERFVVGQVRKWLPEYPMVVLVGPRKVGKTTVLLQLAVEYSSAGAEYLNCNYTYDVERLDHLIDNDFSGLLLLDEFQMLDDPNTYMHVFNTMGEQDSNFRVVITGSVVSYIRYLAQMKGGGRNRLLHIPLLTYLEYLYFTDRVSNYNIDLVSVDYEDSFLDYMTLKNLHQFRLPLLDGSYVNDTIIEIETARKISPYTIALLNSNEGDVQRALLLLAYRLIKMFSYNKTFNEPIIGNLELKRASIAEKLRNMDVFSSFSVWKAAHPSMTPAQIEEALRYLLWSDLALCNFVERDINSKVDSSFLAGLYLGKPLTRSELERLFSNIVQVYIVNPLWYSLVAEELWIVLDNAISNVDSVDSVFVRLSRTLKDRNSFLTDPHLIGNWVEAYLRGSYALLGATPLKTMSFQDDEGKEIDIVRGFPENILIEVAVKTEEKKAKDVNFHLAYTGVEKCFLTTKNTLEKVTWNGVPILRIPYSMLAAFLDRGEIPDAQTLSC